MKSAEMVIVKFRRDYKFDFNQKLRENMLMEYSQKLSYFSANSLWYIFFLHEIRTLLTHIHLSLKVMTRVVMHKQ